ncbi:MAG: YbeD family protein [Desulfosudaceae bacterium]
MQRPHIQYPCRWSYRVIGRDRQAVTCAVAECCRGYEYELAESNRSRHGKYLSLAVSVQVPAESDRDGLYRALAGHPDVKMVL